MKIVHCKIVGDRQEGKCPVCGRRISHGILNGPRRSHCLNCKKECPEYYIFTPGVENSCICYLYSFDEDMENTIFVGDDLKDSE